MSGFGEPDGPHHKCKKGRAGIEGPKRRTRNFCAGVTANSDAGNVRCLPQSDELSATGAGIMNSLGDQLVTLVFNSFSSVIALILQSVTNALIESLLLPLIDSIAVALGLAPQG